MNLINCQARVRMHISFHALFSSILYRCGCIHFFLLWSGFSVALLQLGRNLECFFFSHKKRWQSDNFFNANLSRPFLVRFTLGWVVLSDISVACAVQNANANLFQNVIFNPAFDKLPHYYWCLRLFVARLTSCELSVLQFIQNTRVPTCPYRRP